MHVYLSFSFLLFFFGYNHQDVFNFGDSLALERSQLSILDSSRIDQRNNLVKRSLFSSPSDSSLMAMAQETLDFSQFISYQKGALMANECLGLIYQYSFSNPFRALDYYFQALSLAEQNPTLNDYKWGIQGNIATIYYEQEEYEKALDLFREVALNSESSALTAILNMGNIFGSIQKNDSAIFYFKKALNYSQIQNNPVQLANLYSNLSFIYVQAGQVDEAMAAAEKSLALVDSLEIDFVRPTAYANAAMAFLGKEKLEKAEMMALESLKYSEEQGNLFVQKSAWGTLSDIYTAQGKYKESLDAYLQFSLFKDSLNNQNRRVEISRKQMAFDFEKERTQANAEILRQQLVNQYLLILGVLSVVLLLTGIYFYKRRRDELSEKKDAEFRALVSETELKALRSQMNPHFIFNSLNSIGDFILKNDSEAAQDYLSKFGKLMRMVLENSGQNEISLAEDLAFLEMYLQIESKRKPGMFSYTIQVPDHVDTDAVLVPPMLLQPFIENSIWHAFTDQGKKGELVISFKVSEETLLCTVEDNGVGRKSERPSLGKKSMGVTITENRIKILNERVGYHGKLQIIDKPMNSGTRVEITLPLQLAF